MSKNILEKSPFTKGIELRESSAENSAIKNSLNHDFIKINTITKIFFNG